jgi:hypothetical protein
VPIVLFILWYQDQTKTSGQKVQKLFVSLDQATLQKILQQATIDGDREIFPTMVKIRFGPPMKSSNNKPILN